MADEPRPPLDIKPTRTPQPIRVGGGWAFVHVLAALGAIGGAIWLVAVQGTPLGSPQVAILGLGAIWFAARAALSFAKRRGPS
jgi:hypothetical protein